MIEYLTGDATYPIDDGAKNHIIAHIVNDKGGWGKGFVTAISNRWMNPEISYRIWYGAQSYSQIPFALGNVQLIRVEPNVFVANMLAQHGYRTPANPVPLNYGALGQCLNKLRDNALKHEASVHMPRIGSGLAGGTWAAIEPIINLHFADFESGVYVYDLPS